MGGGGQSDAKCYLIYAYYNTLLLCLFSIFRHFFILSKSGRCDNVYVGEFDLVIMFKEIVYLLKIEVYYSEILLNGCYMYMNGFLVANIFHFIC